MSIRKGRVAGAVAIVTGGASGLGLASARRLAEEGATVIITDINAQLGSTEAAKIPGARFVEQDVSSEKSWRELIAAVVADDGGLDVLVNNAGIAPMAHLLDTTEEMWHEVNAINATGTFFGCKYGYRAMLDSGGGSIINVSSTVALQGAPNFLAYAASKGAVRSMTKSIACFSVQNGHRIRCNSVHPGKMQTPMLQRICDVVQAGNADAARDLAKMWAGLPEDIANMVLFLASDESQSVNGAELVVDNTMTITEGSIPAIDDRFVRVSAQDR